MNIYPGPDHGINFAPFAIVCAQATITLPILRAWVWVLACAVISVATSMLAYGAQIGYGGSALIGLANATGFAFFAVVGGLMRQAIQDCRRSEALNRELEAANAQLKVMTARAQHLAVAEERNRLARDLHDSLGHRLTVAVVQLEGAQRLIPSDPDRAARMVGTMREQIREALGDLRRNVAALRAPTEEDLPLQSALTRLTADFEAGTGLRVYLEMPPRLPALSNAQKHASARQAWVRIRDDPGRIAVEVADDGVGAADSGDSAFGLMGLRERAGQLGGAVKLGPAPQGGALMTFEIPMAGAPAEGA